MLTLAERHDTIVLMLKTKKSHVLAGNGEYGLCMFASDDFRITPTTSVIHGKLVGKAEDCQRGRMVRVFRTTFGHEYWIYSDWSAKRVK